MENSHQNQEAKHIHLPAPIACYMQGGNAYSLPTHCLCPSLIQLTSLGSYWNVSSAMQGRRLILTTVYVPALTAYIKITIKYLICSSIKLIAP